MFLTDEHAARPRGMLPQHFAIVQVTPFRMAVSGLDCWLPVAFGSVLFLIFAADSSYDRRAGTKQFKNADIPEGA